MHLLKRGFTLETSTVNGDGSNKNEDRKVIPMNRIEQIKQKLHECQYVYVGESIPLNDVEYLLSKLEIAEKELEKISVPMPGSRDNELVLYYERTAAEALKRIRD